MTDPLTALAEKWAAEASDLEVRYHDARGAALFRLHASELTEAIRETESRTLTLTEASAASGYSGEHLRHLVSIGRIPNAGRRGAPRIRRSDLPSKPGPIAGPLMDEAELEARKLAAGR